MSSAAVDFDDDDEIQLTDVVIRNGSGRVTFESFPMPDLINSNISAPDSSVQYDVKVEEKHDEVQVEGFSYALDPLDAADLQGGGGGDDDDSDVQVIQSDEESSSSGEDTDAEENQETKVFVKYLPQLWRNQHLQKLMVEYGPIVSAQVKLLM